MREWWHWFLKLHNPWALLAISVATGKLTLLSPLAIDLECIQEYLGYYQLHSRLAAPFALTSSEVSSIMITLIASRRSPEVWVV